MVKRIVTLAIFALIAIGAKADTQVVDGIEWTYKVSDGKASVGAGYYEQAISKSTQGAIVIPATLGGYKVTSIGAYAFLNCSGLTSVTIPNNITRIESSAFEYCSGLASVTIPDSVTSIMDCAFSDCSGLESVTIPDGVTFISPEAFRNCSGLMTFEVSEDNLNYKSDSGLLLAKDGTTLVAGVNGEVTIPNGVTSIGWYAFEGRGGLTSVTIPDSVTNIEYSAFLNCSGLTSVTIPDSVTSIYNYAFEYCSSVTNIIIGSGVTTIGEYAFSGCSSLVSVVIPGNIKNVDNWFDQCGLTTVVINDGVTSIGGGAFSYCRNLTNVSIPASVTNIAPGAFRGCNLSSFFVAESNPCYCSVAGLLLSKDGKSLIGGINGDVVIPNSVTNIADHAFHGRRELASIAVPDGVTSIGASAFYLCTGLESISIPNGIKSIGGYAFGACDSLTKIDIPYGVTSIGEYTFVACNSLLTIKIPNSVTSIGRRAFNGCAKLADIKISNSVTSIGEHAFVGCNCLTSITIPDSVKSIGFYAFSCSNLTNVTMQGDAPISVNAPGIVGDYGFDGVADGCVVRIPRGNETYAVSDGKWQGMTVEYYDPEQDSPVISIDEEKMEEPEDKEDGTRTIAVKVDPLENESEIAELVESVTISVTVGAETVDTTAGYNKTYNPVLNQIVITLKEPEVGLAATQIEAEKVEGDATGMLADLEDANVTLSTPEPEPTAEETASGNTEVGALPVKTVKGLYYQAHWGNDLGGMRSGEKVQATGDKLYLGVIKQTGTQGFYKVTVSEK